MYELSEPVVLNKQVDCHCEQKKNADAEEKNEAPQGLHKTMSVVAMENVQKNDSKLTKVKLNTKRTFFLYQYKKDFWELNIRI